MNNQGKITVFLCLMLSGLLLLGLTILNVVSIHSSRGKITMCARTALFNVRAEYNSYIFDQYHILLFDMNQGGRGQAYLEEKIITDMEENLGEGFSVNDCAITEYATLADNDCQFLKEQIQAYMLYAAIQDVGEEIISATDGTDGTLSQELLNEMNNVQDSSSEQFDSIASGEGGTEEETEDISLTEVEDPRSYTTWLGNLGILTFVVPDGMSVSREKVDITTLPSFQVKIDSMDIFQINTKFDDIDNLESDLVSHSTWIDKLGDAGFGISYAKKVFNSATDSDKNEDTVLKYEMEYLVAGKSSDFDNLESVSSKIVAIRLPINYAYLVKDTSKMSQVSSVATPLSVLVGIPQPVLKYLLAGCWSYVESLVEVKTLLEGKTLPFKKDSTNWITDFNDLENGKYESAVEDENGLDYEDYLCILLAFEEEKMYERMLDIIQLNACKHSGDIDLMECGVDISVDISVSYEGRESNFNISAGY